MGPLGMPELVIIFVVALIIFGPRKLPDLGRSLGKGLSEFKRASSEFRSTLDDEIRSEERRVTQKAVTAPPPPVIPEADPVATEPDVETYEESASGQPETVARGSRPA